MKLFIKILCSACFVAPLFSTTPVFSSQNISLSSITADTLLEKAIFNDSTEEIQQAVQSGANIDHANGKPPLLLAVLLKKAIAIETLINLGANLEISYEGYELVHYALKLEDFKSALLLVKAGATLGKPKDLHQKGVIYLAIEGLGNIYTKSIALELIQAMIDNGYPVISVDWRTNGWYAVLGGYRSIECLKILIDGGMDVNQKILLPHMGVKKTTFSTPLFRAIDYHNEEAIKILLDSGANIDQKMVVLNM